MRDSIIIYFYFVFFLLMVSGLTSHALNDYVMSQCQCVLRFMCYRLCNGRRSRYGNDERSWLKVSF